MKRKQTKCLNFTNHKQRELNQRELSKRSLIKRIKFKVNKQIDERVINTKRLLLIGPSLRQVSGTPAGTDDARLGAFNLLNTSDGRELGLTAADSLCLAQFIRLVLMRLIHMRFVHMRSNLLRLVLA